MAGCTFSTSLHYEKYSRGYPCQTAQVTQRPCFVRLRGDDPRLELAVFGETVFWQMLDRLRTQVYQTAVAGTSRP